MSKQKRTAFIYPFSAYIGSMLGVGIYGLPYVLQQSGLVLFFVYLVIVTALIVTLYSMFADVSYGTSRNERFLGYIGEYVGKKVEKFFLWVRIISGWGAALSLLLVWGVLAHEVFLGVVDIPAIAFSFFFFLITLPILYRGGRSVESIDVIVLFGVVLLFVILYFLGNKYLNSIILVPSNTFGYVLPYGTLMFAFWGAGVIPEVVNQLRPNPKLLKRLLLIGVISVAVVYGLFAIFVVSISGARTTEVAIVGLDPYIGRAGIIVGSLLGMATIWLSYNNSGWVARNILMYDLHMSRRKAMLVLFVPPIVLLLLGVQNFVLIMSVVGAVGLGLKGYIIVWMYAKSHNARFHRSYLFKKFAKPALYMSGTLLIMGVIIELVLLAYKYI